MHNAGSGDEEQWSEWMAAAQRGDKACYQQLLESISHVIAAYLRSRFGAPDFVDDCIQECLLAVHRGRHSYDPRRPFRPWLFAIVRHTTVDALRRQRSYPDTVPTDNAVTASANGVRIADDHEAPAADEALSHLQTFAALAPHQRQALVLTKVIGLSIREAARRAGTSEAAMKVRVHRAIGALRRMLEADLR